MGSNPFWTYPVHSTVTTGLNPDGQIQVPDERDTLNYNLAERDKDSAYGSDNESEENGSTGSWGPDDDEDALTRLQDLSRHRGWKDVLDGELYTANIDNPERVLDIGTGTGIWALNMANKYPSSKVVGIDSSAMEPIYRHENIEFYTDNINSSDYQEDGQYNLINGRELLGSVVDWPGLFRTLFKALEPGGWLNWAEPSIHVRPITTLNRPDIFSRWVDIFIAAEKVNGMSFDISSKLGKWLEETGFVNVGVRKITVPIGGKTRQGSWNKKRLLLGEFSARRLWNLFNWEFHEFTVDVALIRRELINQADATHFQDFYFVHGQKPLEG